MPLIIIPNACYDNVKKEVQTWTENNLGTPPSYDDSLQPTIDQWGFPWFRAGTLVVDHASRILMMHEARVQIKKLRDEQLKENLLAQGHQPNEWIDGDGGWNLPAGRLRLKECFEEAGLREVKEETGWTIVIERLLYIRHSEKPSNKYIMPVYFGFPTLGPAKHRTAETSEIGWFTSEEIHSMAANGQLRSPDFVLESLKAYQDNPSIH